MRQSVFESNNKATKLEVKNGICAGAQAEFAIQATLLLLETISNLYEPPASAAH